MNIFFSCLLQILVHNCQHQGEAERHFSKLCIATHLCFESLKDIILLAHSILFDLFEVLTKYSLHKDDLWIFAILSFVPVGPDEGEQALCCQNSLPICSSAGVGSDSAPRYVLWNTGQFCFDIPQRLLLQNIFRFQNNAKASYACVCFYGYILHKITAPRKMAFVARNPDELQVVFFGGVLMSEAADRIFNFCPLICFGHIYFIHFVSIVITRSGHQHSWNNAVHKHIMSAEEKLLKNLSESLYNPSKDAKVFLYSPKYGCDNVKTVKADVKVIWAVIAVKRARLDFQEKYWVKLHKNKIVNDVHLWDFTWTNANQSEREKDLEAIRTKVSNYDFVTLHRPNRNLPASYIWAQFYKHYAEISSDNDVVVKVDDDIIFVNASEFKCFVNYVHEKQEVLTVSANVVNNGVVAHIQQLLGIVPFNVATLEYPKGGKLGSLWASAEKCFSLHKYFTEHPDNFWRPDIIRYKERMSINFIAFSGRRAKEVFVLTQDHGGDEAGITAFANTQMGATNVVYMRLVVAHASFGEQDKSYPKLNDKILTLYQNASFIYEHWRLHRKMFMLKLGRNGWQGFPNLILLLFVCPETQK